MAQEVFGVKATAAPRSTETVALRLLERVGRRPQGSTGAMKNTTKEAASLFLSILGSSTAMYWALHIVSTLATTTIPDAILCVNPDPADHHH